jgi:hypothetical protein
LDRALRELRILNLVVETGKGKQREVILTDKGSSILGLWNSKSVSELKQSFLNLWMSTYEDLPKLLFLINSTLKKMIFIPKPPIIHEFKQISSTLNIRSPIDRRKYAEYCQEVAYGEFRKLSRSFNKIDLNDFLDYLDNQLTERISSAQKKTQSYLIESAEYVISNYFLNKFLSPSISITYADFIVWRERLYNLDVINYTHHYSGLKGQITYALGEYTDGMFHRDISSANWKAIKDDFTNAVIAAYKKIYSDRNSSFVPIADVRDLTCFKLRLTDNEFDNLFKVLYQNCNTGEVKLKISLDSDSIMNQASNKRKPLSLSKQAGARSVMCVRV